jgi:Spy/CpxP family protein refolding chaperone
MEAEFRFENLRKRRKRVMKKLLIALMAVGVLALGTAAYAHMWGGGPGWGGGQHMWGGGPGYGSGPGMMYGYGDKETRKFFDETADQRKELHNKMFEYREARWAGDAEKAEALEKDISELQAKMYEKAEGAGITKRFGRGGYGPGGCGGPGYGRE